MKNAILLVLLITCFTLTSCGTAPQKKLPDFQAIISLVVPPSFTGNGGWEHHNIYYNFKLEVKGLRKDAAGMWFWDSLTYEDTSNFWHGKVYYSQAGQPAS